jgi:RNA polymerase sigma-70 factor (ECF subfamily)
MHTTPASLLERLRDSEEKAAWERFVLLYTPLLYHWARRLSLSGQDADDLVQDVFVLLVRELPKFNYDPQKRFRGWLWSITLNKCRERKRRAQAVPVPTSAQPDLAVADNTEAIDDEEYRRYLVQRALKLMEAEFQPQTLKAFHECIAADRPAADVAAELGVSIDSVYAAKSRVLRRLREELAGLLD